LSIREIIKTSKTSTLIDNIEKNLKDIKNNINKITKKPATKYIGNSTTTADASRPN